MNVLDLEEVDFDRMRNNKNVGENLVVLNTPRLLGPPDLPVLLCQSSPILLVLPDAPS